MLNEIWHIASLLSDIISYMLCNISFCAIIIYLNQDIKSGNISRYLINDLIDILYYNYEDLRNSNLICIIDR